MALLTHSAIKTSRILKRLEKLVEQNNTERKEARTSEYKPTRPNNASNSVSARYNVVPISRKTGS